MQNEQVCELTDDELRPFGFTGEQKTMNHDPKTRLLQRPIPGCGCRQCALERAGEAAAQFVAALFGFSL